MKKIIINCIIVVIAALFLFLTSGYAERKTDEVLYQFRGKAVSLGNTRITVTNRIARDITRTIMFLITKTTIIHGKLSRGSTVHITYTIDRTGKQKPARTALVIQVIETANQRNM